MMPRVITRWILRLTLLGNGVGIGIGLGINSRVVLAMNAVWLIVNTVSAVLADSEGVNANR